LVVVAVALTATLMVVLVVLAAVAVRHQALEVRLLLGKAMPEELTQALRVLAVVVRGLLVFRLLPH